MFSPDVAAELGAVLRERHAAATERLASLAGHFQDIVDAAANSNADDEHDPEGATIAFERSQVDALAQSARRELEEIAAALVRLDDGAFGTCEVCGQPIPVERLRARPMARTCVSCAASR